MPQPPAESEFQSRSRSRSESRSESPSPEVPFPSSERPSAAGAASSAVAGTATREVLDALRRLQELPGVAGAVEAARSACTRLRWHPALRRRGVEARAEAGIRAAQASAALAGAVVPVDRVRAAAIGSDALTADPTELTALGALRAQAEAERLSGAWQRAGMQALARLHTAATAGLLEESALGRPRPADRLPRDGADLVGPDGLALPAPVGTALAERMAGLTALLAAGTTGSAGARSGSGSGGGRGGLGPGSGSGVGSGSGGARSGLGSGGGGLGIGTRPEAGVPALLVAALVHAELICIRPFLAGNGVVARALCRAIVVDLGLDPTGVAVWELGLLRSGPAYSAGLARYAQGTPDGVAGWLISFAEAVVAGAAEGSAVCDAVLAGRLPRLSSPS